MGFDEFGNEYFSQKRKAPKNERRWVVFKGLAEGSKIPPGWYGWIHKTRDLPPSEATKKLSWQQSHLPNLTGTKHAYMRPEYKESNKRKVPLKAYEAWTPADMKWVENEE